MELRAIIGKKTGNIEEYDSIISYFKEIRANFQDYSGYGTDATKLEDFDPEKILGKNLYIHVSNLKDPQNFYHYLSQNNFVLIDSKIVLRDSKINL